MVTASLCGHAAGNGRYSQSKPTATMRLLYSESPIWTARSWMNITFFWAYPIFHSRRSSVTFWRALIALGAGFDDGYKEVFRLCEELRRLDAGRDSSG